MRCVSSRRAVSNKQQRRRTFINVEIRICITHFDPGEGIVFASKGLGCYTSTKRTSCARRVLGGSRLHETLKPHKCGWCAYLTCLHKPPGEFIKPPFGMDMTFPSQFSTKSMKVNTVKPVREVSSLFGRHMHLISAFRGIDVSNKLGMARHNNSVLGGFQRARDSSPFDGSRISANITLKIHIVH